MTPEAHDIGGQMSYKALYAYAWDLAETTVSVAVEQVIALGINTITIAGSYHAGKFIRPRGRAGKVYFPEDGAAFFRADASRYGAIRPVVSALTAQHDILRELSETDTIATNVWLVLMHNTRLGETHPGATVTNAFGDRYVYNLCPSAPEARAYAVTLCKDVTDNYSVDGISIETPGFLPYAHGFHHEFALVKTNRWLDSQLGLCFCDHCLHGAAAAGVDAQRLRVRVREDVEAYLASEFDLPDDMAEAIWLGDTRTDGDLSAFLRWRCDLVTGLIRDVRAAVRPDATVAVIPSADRPTGGAWYEGSDIRALAQAAGILEACFYQPSPDRVRCDAWDVQRRLRGAGALRGILRPAHPDLASRDAVVGAVTALRQAGIEDLAFYNYGHLRESSLRWIADALAQSGG
jgi:hypothetical protein